MNQGKNRHRRTFTLIIQYLAVEVGVVNPTTVLDEDLYELSFVWLTIKVDHVVSLCPVNHFDLLAID